MNALIVHAHPEPLSMNAALAATAASALREEGFDVEVSDLYKQGFHAVASAADFTHPCPPRTPRLRARAAPRYGGALLLA